MASVTFGSTALLPQHLLRLPLDSVVSGIIRPFTSTSPVLWFFLSCTTQPKCDKTGSAPKKLRHTWRLADLLASFDGQLRASVGNSLSGDLPDHSWWRATTGVTVGGLGLRTAVTVALPAFVASRILSRPLVVTMVDHLCAAIGASRQTIMAEYDARTDEALSRLASTLPTASALDLLAKLDEAYAESHLSWQNVLSGSEPAMRDHPPPCPSPRPGHHA